MLDFQGQNILEFTERFKDEESCLSYLANLKWQDGFVCKKCNLRYVKPIKQGIVIDVIM